MNPFNKLHPLYDPPCLIGRGGGVRGKVVGEDEGRG